MSDFAFGLSGGGEQDTNIGVKTCLRLSVTGLVVSMLVMARAAAADGAMNQLTTEEKAAGWKVLFDGRTLAGWHSFRKHTAPTNGWTFEDGWLHCQGTVGGDLISDAEFGDFELRWEWKQAPGGNSGLKYFVSEAGSDPRGHEYQMIDDEVNADAKLAQGKRVTAAFYDVLKPTGTHPRPMGEINESRVIVKGDHVEHWLNGEKVLEYECGSEALKAAVAESKFKNAAGFTNKIKAHLLLQDHHSEVWFRNIKVRPLN